MKEAISVINSGAKGNGKYDSYNELQTALFSEYRTIVFPKGTYITSHTLLIPSHKKLVFEEGAVLKLWANIPLKRGDFLLCNADIINGNEDITIEGGTLDGNNTCRFHKRPKNIFAKDGYSGILINFCNVKNLQIRNVRLANPVAYFTRFCKINNFVLENITLSTGKIMPNQDGIHFCGEVRNGMVKNISADTFGTTNDDLVALNADDFTGRIECFDTVNGDIENVVFDGIYSESSHCAIRLLSFQNNIKNITIKNMNVGYRTRAINCDCARDCRARLFDESDYPSGVGKLQNITIENCTFFKANIYPLFWQGSHDGLLHDTAIKMQTLADNMEIKNCTFLPSPPQKPHFPQPNFILNHKLAKQTLSIATFSMLTNTEITADGKSYKLNFKSDSVTLTAAKNIKITKLP